jgi:signal transduction histidine kinase
MANAVNHGEASELRVEVNYNASSILLLIRDNGHGFNGDRNQGGWGILHMRERAQEMKGRLTVETYPGVGTAIELVVPFVLSA